MIISGTGHRPNKLGGYSQESFDKLFNVAYNHLRDNNYTKVISGMALGWDQALAQAAISLDIPVIAAVPFKGQESAWPQKSIDYYNELISKCSEVVIVCEGRYAAWKMQVRNEWMVNNSDLVLAMYDNTPGGTGNCIRYAKDKKKRIINLYEDWEKLK